MRIKKSNLNEYIRTSEGVWVRNFTITCAPKKDINVLSKPDASLFLKNEIANQCKIKNGLSSFQWENIVIVSDGMSFNEKQKLLTSLPYQNIKIIAVNKALAKWKLLGAANDKRMINFYLTNNPYSEVMSSLPVNHQYYPPCLASLRTNPEFINKYKGEMFLYSPIYDPYYSHQNDLDCKLDDYRNPICAAISFAWQLGVKNLLLFCCDDSFEERRPGSVQLDNGAWTYPQQIMSQNIIDAQLYWLKNSGVKIFDHSDGINYKNATYITADNIVNFTAG
jgi:hypothetical protein